MALSLAPRTDGVARHPNRLPSRFGRKILVPARFQGQPGVAVASPRKKELLTQDASLQGTSSVVHPASGRRFQLSGLLASVGPGLVYGLTVLGAGDIVSNTTAGASYGYHLIWALGMSLIFRYVWVNTSAKYVLVSGESLLTGYGRVGIWVPLVVLVALFPIRHFENQFLILMTGSAAQLLCPLPTAWSQEIWALLFALVGFAMMFWGGYPIIESFCKLLIGLMGGSLLIAGLLSNPDPAAIVEGTFIPSLPQVQGLYSALLIVMALIGTEAGSTGNLTYAYFILEKGWKGASRLRKQRVDLVLGVVCLFVMGALVQIAAAGVIHPLGLQLEEPADMGRVFSETQGPLGLLVFSLGLWGAAFTSFVGLNIGHALILTDFCRSFVPGLKRSAEEGRGSSSVKKDPIYRAIILFWSFAPLYIVFTGTRLIWLVLTVTAFPVMLIPILGLSLLKITNDPELMGQYRNGWLTNSILALMVLVALYFAYSNGANLWKSVTG
jgi:Mn2+/Fe2+ NRAMP family transporter